MDALVSDDTLVQLNDILLDNVSTLNTWEVWGKSLIKEIITHYHNHSQWDSLDKLVENEPTKIEILRDQAQAVSINVESEYDDNVMSIMCNHLKNLNGEDQAYFNLWTRDKNLLEIAKAWKE